MKFFIKFSNRSTTSALSLRYFPPLLLLLLACLIATSSRTVATASDIDTLPVPIHKLVDTYEAVRAKSWRLIEQQYSQASGSPSAEPTDAVKAKIVKELFIYHDSFLNNDVAIYERENKDPQSFPEFNHFYEWNYVQGHLNAINSLFEAFRLYLGKALQTNEIGALGARDFAETVLHDKKWPIGKSFNDIHHITVDQGLYYKMALVFKYSSVQHISSVFSPLTVNLTIDGFLLQDSSEHVCSTQRSGQQVLYQMYTAVALTELKGYAMMQFSWMLLRTYGVGNFTKEADLMRQRFESRTNKTHVVLQKVMERADNCLWRCDAPENEEGRTYERLTKLLQGYVENEVDLNNEETCRETCEHYQYTESFTCFKELYCSKQPKCTGKVLYCQYFDSDMWICPAVS